MNALLAWFVRNPVAANLLMLIIVAGGLVASTRIDNEFFPDIQPNIVQVSVPYPGAGPLEVEEQICIKIEEAISDVQGIKEVKSSASQGLGMVTIETVEGWDVQRMVSDVKTRVDAISTFPGAAERPIVSDLSLGTQVIQLVLFGGHDEQAIKDLALDLKDPAAVATVRRLPALIDAVERLAEQARVGIRLHPDTRRAQVSRRTATVAMALAVTALAVALFALAG